MGVEFLLCAKCVLGFGVIGMSKRDKILHSQRRQTTNNSWIFTSDKIILQVVTGVTIMGYRE